MRLFRSCSLLVIGCFKRVEHFADWITGAAGPYFVGFCWFLILGGGFCFFDVIGRNLSWWTSFLLSPILLLTPLNLYGQYFLVCAVPSGFPSPRALALSRNPVPGRERWLAHDTKSRLWPEAWGWRRRQGILLDPDTDTDTEARGGGGGGGGGGRRLRRCRKCDGPKPERTHHCSVCKRCVLLMDHHCPWINGCVGLYNQRHFVLFMVWLSVACWTTFALGYNHFWSSLDYSLQWNAISPRIAFTLLWVLSIAIGVAVPVLASWHLYMVSKGETSIESHDNAYLEGRAKAEGLIYLNPYDLGPRQNLRNFFNVGPAGYPLITLLFPLLVPPYSNGFSFPRRSLPPQAHADLNLHTPELADGLVASESGRVAWAGEGSRGKYVMGDNGSLTDDEEGGGGYID